MAASNINARINKIVKKQSVRRLKSVFAVVSDIFSLVLRSAFIVFLVIMTSAMVFACIFVVYIKTNLSDELAISLEEASLNLSSTLYYTDEDNNLHELVKLQSTEYRIWVDYSEIPLYMEHALVAIEDHRFYGHQGVDWFRTVSAFSNMFLQMKDTFGGSTITQQLIKNLTGDDDVTIARKFQEIFRALDFEKRYDKAQIVTWYLNRVTFGGRCYGVAAAADYYFGKTLSELTLAECASIIGITNNPSRYNPYISRENNKERQELILTRMYTQGFISLEEMNDAIAETLVFKRGENSTFTEDIYTWFEEAVIAEVVNDFALLRNTSAATARDILSRGGYAIITTLNPEIQAYMDSVYEDIENLPKTRGSAQQLQSAMVIMNPYNGHVVALSGGVGKKTQNLVLNRATMDLARRPPGSSIKPLSVYAPAMDLNLITTDTVYDDSASAVLAGRPDWLPKNDDRMYLGPMSIRTAIVKSRNTIAAQVLDKLTPSVSYRFLSQTLGFKLEEADLDYAPLSIGQFTIGATPLEMASGFSIFPNGGVRTEGITYTYLIDHSGNIIIDNQPAQTIAVSETTAYWMSDILHDAVLYGTGGGANLGSMPTAGKTGTSGDFKDRWFTGFTPYYVASVWTGYDKPETISLVVNANPASAIFKRVMSLVHANLPVKNFSTPENTYQPPVPGIAMTEYTIRYTMVPDGLEFYTKTETGRVGEEITVLATEMEDYTIVSGASAAIVLSINPEENIVTFQYEYTPPETPEPSPSSSPSPESSPEPEPSPSPTSTPTPVPSPMPSPSPMPEIPDIPDYQQPDEATATPPWG